MRDPIVDMLKRAVELDLIVDGRPRKLQNIPYHWMRGGRSVRAFPRDRHATNFVFADADLSTTPGCFWVSAFNPYVGDGLYARFEYPVATDFVPIALAHLSFPIYGSEWGLITQPAVDHHPRMTFDERWAFEQERQRAEEEARKNKKRSLVYFIQALDGGPIKIGKAVDQLARLKELQTASSKRLHILATMDGGRAQESALHKRFKQYRLSGEWHEPADELVGFVASLK